MKGCVRVEIVTPSESTTARDADKRALVQMCPEVVSEIMCASETSGAKFALKRSRLCGFLSRLFGRLSSASKVENQFLHKALDSGQLMYRMVCNEAYHCESRVPEILCSRLDLVRLLWVLAGT
jgi:hypothetical protein